MAFNDFQTDWKLVPVHGHYLKIDGTPVQGKIIFNPRPAIIMDGPALVTVMGDPIEVVLNAYGEFSVDLPASDDPDLTPFDWTYQVTEQFLNAVGQSYDIALSVTHYESGYDLTAAIPVEPNTGSGVVIDRDEFDELVAEVAALALELDGGNPYSEFDPNHELDGGEPDD